MKIVKAKIQYATAYTHFDIQNLELDCAVPFHILIKKLYDYVIIIEAGTTITQKIYALLQKQEELYISKKDKEKEKLSPQNLQIYLHSNKTDMEKTLRLINTINNTIFEAYLKSEKNIINILSIEEVVKSVIYLIKSQPGFLKKAIPFFVFEYQIAHHSLHVLFYSIHLGHFLQLEDIQLLRLGTAALLHDIGVKKVMSSILEKEDVLTPDELESAHKHSTYSVEIAKQNAMSDPYIINAIMHHHECFDGSGYPQGLKGENISTFASILCICDVFDALTSERPHREKYSYFEALKLMMKDPALAKKYNQEQLRVFLHSLL
ncbi:MAG: HD domain-containing phosphohydrolase [Sulfurimonas sp.]